MYQSASYITDNALCFVVVVFLFVFLNFQKCSILQRNSVRLEFNLNSSIELAFFNLI